MQSLFLRNVTATYSDVMHPESQHTTLHESVGVAVAVAAGCGVAYFFLLRGPILTWGATVKEAARRLPGDELLEDADGVSTRVIDINAPASAVWPWIVQMGPSPRGGAYTCDWIENLLGLNMHSADSVLPEFQHPQIGDTIGFRLEPNATATTRAGTRARLALAGRQLGLDVRPHRGTRPHTAAQS
jgi:hypothetical protein